MHQQRRWQLLSEAVEDLKKKVSRSEITELFNCSTFSAPLESCENFEFGLTAFIFNSHIYPLIIHSDDSSDKWELELTLGRKLAIKFRQKISSLTKDLKPSSLLALELCSDKEDNVYLTKIILNPLELEDYRLELAIRRSGVYWVDLLEQALAS